MLENLKLKEKFFVSYASVLHLLHPNWPEEQVEAVCNEYWRHWYKDEEIFTAEAQFKFVPVEETVSEEAAETTQTGTKNMIAIIGDRFMNGGFLPKEVLEKCYKKWDNTLHDINHMGTSTGFFLMQSDITYFIGYHSNVKYDKETKEVSMQLNIEPDCEFTAAWEAYVKLCERARRIPNVSVTYYAKRDWITASELPKNVPWKKEGYGKDDLVPILNWIDPVCVSTVLEGRCNDKDGCGLRNNEVDEKLEAELEEKRQELIKQVKILEEKVND